MKAGADAIRRLYKGTIQLRGGGDISSGVKILEEFTIVHMLIAVAGLIVLLFVIISVYRNRFKINRQIMRMKGTGHDN